MSYGKEKKQEVVEQKPRTIWYVDQKQKEQFDKLGYPLESSNFLLDNDLTYFMSNIKDESVISTTITIMVRTKAYDYASKTRKEYVYWYETLRGTDSNGHAVRQVDDLPCGVSNLIPEEDIQYSESGNKAIPIRNPVGKCKTVYTVPFDKAFIEKLVEQSDRTDKDTIQFQVNGSKSFGGYTYLEWLECSLEELDQRGRLGVAGMYGPEFEFTELPAAEKLAVMVNNKK